jgi:hypothetical protein
MTGRKYDKGLHTMCENTELRSFLYKLLFGTLSCNQNFDNKKGLILLV